MQNVLFKEIGVDYFVIKPVGDYEKNNYKADKELKDKFNEQLLECEALSDGNYNCTVRWDMFGGWEKKDYNRCYSLPFMPVIDSDGGIYACGGYWQDPDSCYGNLNENTFIKIWESQKRKDRRITRVSL